MASVHNYTFDNLSRIGDDLCGIIERDLQNQQFGTYSTTNYFAKYCGMEKPIAFATSQPNVFYNGGYGNYCGAGGCNIQEGSNLQIGSIQTRSKCRISLYERPFATVPYLGRGPSRPVIESRLQQGGYSGNKKSCKTVTEKPFNYDQTPLVPSLAASIQNPNNLVEGVAADGWIRGGLPSRELTRDADYIQRKSA
tara:strand:+ start:594 stop:1178 length:585 start_codon:yes stop_codon:yes gene_type:complete